MFLMQETVLIDCPHKIQHQNRDWISNLKFDNQNKEYIPFIIQSIYIYICPLCASFQTCSIVFCVYHKHLFSSAFVKSHTVVVLAFILCSSNLATHLKWNHNHFLGKEFDLYCWAIHKHVMFILMCNCNIKLHLHCITLMTLWTCCFVLYSIPLLTTRNFPMETSCCFPRKS